MLWTSNQERGMSMKNLKITERTYDLICNLVATYLENEMLDGQIAEWDKTNCEALNALIELNILHN